MVVNARNQRKIQSRQMDHEARSLRVALKSELSANKKSYEDRIQQFSETTDFSGGQIQNITFDNIYKELLSKIGILSEEEIEKIVKAYLLIEELPYRLKILEGINNNGYNDEFIWLKREHFSIAADIHSSILPEIMKAIDSISYELSQKKKNSICITTASTRNPQKTRVR